MARLSKDELDRFRVGLEKMRANLSSHEFRDRIIANAPDWAIARDHGIAYHKAVAASVITAVRANPKLLIDCRVSTLYDAVAAIVRRGLTVGDNIAWLVPYKGSVSFQLGWMGLYQLARRANLIINARSQPVYLHDKCVIQLGSDCSVDHTPAPMGQDRGLFVGAYVLLTLPDGIHDIEYMDVAEIERIRQQSPGKNSDAWGNWFSEMGRAKVFKRGMKRVPKPLEYDPTLMLDMDDGVVVHGEDEIVDEERIGRAQIEPPRETPMSIGDIVSRHREKEPAMASGPAERKGGSFHDDGDPSEFDYEEPENSAEGDGWGAPPEDDGASPGDMELTKDDLVALSLPGLAQSQMMTLQSASSKLLQEVAREDRKDRRQWIEAAIQANSSWLRSDRICHDVIRGTIQRLKDKES